MAGDHEKLPQALAERLDVRITANEAKIAALEGRADADAELIAELQADGLVSRERTANLTEALRTSRTIGAAIGILMAQHGVTEDEAFQMLRRASMDTNRKLRALADEVVRDGDLGHHVSRGADQQNP